MQDRTGLASGSSAAAAAAAAARKSNTRDASEGSKDYSLLVHSSLLQNEILGTQIEDFKEASEERRVLSPVPASRNILAVRTVRSAVR